VEGREHGAEQGDAEGRPVFRKEQPRVLDLDDAPRLALDPGDTVTPAW
jgi:hypothetical protein